MNFINLFFSPTGRIGRTTFLRGAILLTGFWIVAIIFIAFGPAAFGGIVSLFGFLSAYCYFCLYGKRMHDAGITAAAYILFLFGFTIVFSVVGGVMVTILNPENADLLIEWDNLRRSGELQKAAELQPTVFRAIIIPFIISMMVANAILAYIAGAFKSDPGTNIYGDPV